MPKIKGHFVGSQEDWVYPVNTTLPMGWTGSILIGQKVHERMFANAVSRLPETLRDVRFVNIADKKGMAWARNNPSDRVIIYSIYLDDLNIFGTVDEVLNAILAHIIIDYRSAGFPVKDSKTSWAAGALLVLGIWLDLTKGELRPMEMTLRILYHNLPKLVWTRKVVDRWVMESLLGKVT